MQWQGGGDGLRGRPSLQALPLEASVWFSWWLGGKEKPAVQKGPEDINLTKGLLSILTCLALTDIFPSPLHQLLVGCCFPSLSCQFQQHQFPTPGGKAKVLF